MLSGKLAVAFSDVIEGDCQDPSPRKNVVLFAVPEPRRAVPTVPEDKFDAFNDVNAEPSPEKPVALTTPVPLLNVKDAEPANAPLELY